MPQTTPTVAEKIIALLRSYDAADSANGTPDHRIDFHNEHVFGTMDQTAKTQTIPLSNQVNELSQASTHPTAREGAKLQQTVQSVTHPGDLILIQKLNEYCVNFAKTHQFHAAQIASDTKIKEVFAKFSIDKASIDGTGFDDNAFTEALNQCLKEIPAAPMQFHGRPSGNSNSNSNGR